MVVSAIVVVIHRAGSAIVSNINDAVIVTVGILLFFSFFVLVVVVVLFSGIAGGFGKSWLFLWLIWASAVFMARRGPGGCSGRIPCIGGSQEQRGPRQSESAALLYNRMVFVGAGQDYLNLVPPVASS